MHKDFNSVVRRLSELTADMAPEQIKGECVVSGSELNILSRLMRRYFAAQRCRYCDDAGIIGVGKISFAEVRLQRFQQRIGCK